jgi:hypothetical protein
MIKALRKRHLQTWTLLAVLIPVCIIAAWIAVPEKVTQELFQKEMVRNTSVTLTSVKKESYKLSLLIDTAKSENAVNLEFINAEKFTAPSLLLYRLIDTTTDNIDKQELLGRIEGKAPHYFPLPYLTVISCLEFSNTAKFVLYDIRKRQPIDTLIFKTSNTGIFL